MMMSDRFEDKTILNSLIASSNFRAFVFSHCSWKRKRKKRHTEGKAEWTWG